MTGIHWHRDFPQLVDFLLDTSRITGAGLEPPHQIALVRFVDFSCTVEAAEVLPPWAAAFSTGHSGWDRPLSFHKWLVLGVTMGMLVIG